MNPMAIRSALDVYGENVRVVIPIDSVQHGRVMVICVGAMMVGSTVITRKAGENVKRAEELGYFKFGGSTILTLFEEGTMKFDDDLVANSNTALETLVCFSYSPLFAPFHFSTSVVLCSYKGCANKSTDQSRHVDRPPPLTNPTYTRHAQKRSRHYRIGPRGCKSEDWRWRDAGWWENSRS